MLLSSCSCLPLLSMVFVSNPGGSGGSSSSSSSSSIVVVVVVVVVVVSSSSNNNTNNNNDVAILVLLFLHDMAGAHYGPRPLRAACGHVRLARLRWAGAQALIALNPRTLGCPGAPRPGDLTMVVILSLFVVCMFRLKRHVCILGLLRVSADLRS